MLCLDRRSVQRRFGLHRSGDLLFGTYRGYVLSLYRAKTAWYITICCRISEDGAAKLRAALPRKTGMYWSLHRFGITAGFFTDAMHLRCLEEYLGRVIPLLRDLGARGADTCPCCGNLLLGEGVWKEIDGNAMLLHAHCVPRAAEELRMDDYLASMEQSELSGGTGGNADRHPRSEDQRRKKHLTSAGNFGMMEKTNRSEGVP